MNPIRFQGRYNVQLQGPFNPDKKTLSRQALEAFAEEVSKAHKTPITIQYETNSGDRVEFSKKGHRKAQPLSTTIKAIVNIASKPKSAPKEFPALEDLDLYNEKPPADADEAFTRFIKKVGVFFQVL